MSASTKCLQIILAVFNLAFLLFGILMLIPGVSYLLAAEKESGAYSSGIGIVAVGAASIVVGIFGCCGAFFRSKCSLIIFSICLICLIIAQCILGGMAFATASNEQKMSEYSNSIWNAMDEDYRSSFQTDNTCCGFNNALDRSTPSCPVQGALRACGPILESNLGSAVNGAGIYLFVSAVCEVIACIKIDCDKYIQMQFTSKKAFEKAMSRVDDSTISAKLQLIRDNYQELKSVHDIAAAISNSVKVVLIGEASHGTSEFYDFRAELTKHLVMERGFRIIACEADWPSMNRVDNYVLGRIHLTEMQDKRADKDAVDALSDFTRFPKWMWRNEVFRRFIDWAHERNCQVFVESDKIRIVGLDLYSMFESIDEVIKYLERVDPKAATLAKKFYRCFDKYNSNSQRYAVETALGISEGCTLEAVTVLNLLIQKRNEFIQQNLERHYNGIAEKADEQFKAEINALVAKDAEQYYRNSMLGGSSGWNERDKHMMKVLELMMNHLQGTLGPAEPAKVIVWAHNSHVGDARYTSMGRTGGQLNIGQLCREKFGEKECFIVGQMTYSGTVSCASDWDSHHLIKNIVPCISTSIENLLHSFEVPCGYLLMKNGSVATVTREKCKDMEFDERFIGVIYAPETEYQSHYSKTFPLQEYDAIVFHSHTRAIKAI